MKHQKVKLLKSNKLDAFIRGEVDLQKDVKNEGRCDYVYENTYEMDKVSGEKCAYLFVKPHGF